MGPRTWGTRDVIGCLFLAQVPARGPALWLWVGVSPWYPLLSSTLLPSLFLLPPRRPVAHLFSLSTSTVSIGLKLRFSKSFYFELILDSLKKCKKKKKKEFPCAQHPVSLNISVLPNMWWSSPGNPHWSHTINLNSWPYAHFTSSAPNILCSQIPFCILFLCLLQWQVLSLSFSVITLTLWHVLVSCLECPSKWLVWGRSFGAGTLPEMTLCPPWCDSSRRSWCWCVLLPMKLALST